MSDVKDVGFYPIRIRRGRNFRLKFQYKPGGVPADLAGMSAHMMVKSKASDSSPWAGFNLGTTTGEITILANGWVEVRVSAAATAALPAMPVTGVYDVVLVDADGFVKQVLEGPVQLLDSVTVV